MLRTCNKSMAFQGAGTSLLLRASGSEGEGLKFGGQKSWVLRKDF